MKIMPNHECFLFYLSILTWLTQNTVKTIFYQELKVALTKELVYSFGIFSRLTTEVSEIFLKKFVAFSEICQRKGMMKHSLQYMSVLLMYVHNCIKFWPPQFCNVVGISKK